MSWCHSTTGGRGCVLCGGMGTRVGILLFDYLWYDGGTTGCVCSIGIGAAACVDGCTSAALVSRYLGSWLCWFSNRISCW